MCQGIGKNVAS